MQTGIQVAFKHFSDPALLLSSRLLELTGNSGQNVSDTCERPHTLMTEPDLPNKPLKLMEYLYLLPAILALAPLWVAYQTTKAEVNQEQLIYAFRLMSLGWLWMLTSTILYCWRPIIRKRTSFTMNVLRATVLGGIALTPIIFGGVLVKSYALDVELYSGLELGLAWFAYISCALVNFQFLRMGMSQPEVSRRLKGWKYYSMGFLCIACLVVIAGVLN